MRHSRRIQTTTVCILAALIASTKKEVNQMNSMNTQSSNEMPSLKKMEKFNNQGTRLANLEFQKLSARHERRPDTKIIPYSGSHRKR